jgi:hypothetical protein
VIASAQMLAVGRDGGEEQRAAEEEPSAHGSTGTRGASVGV